MLRRMSADFVCSGTELNHQSIQANFARYDFVIDAVACLFEFPEEAVDC